MASRTKQYLMIILLLVSSMPVTAAAEEKSVELFVDRLEQIVLLKQPTREQSAAYLGELQALAKLFGLTTNSYNRDYDLLIDKLKQTFPAEHFDLLASEIVHATRLMRAASRALSALDLEPAVFKKGILSKLEVDPALIRVVLVNGWSEDARGSIVKALDAEDSLPTRDWFVAAVELKDPELYKQLHERAIRSPYAVDCIIALQALPDYDLVNTTNEVYERTIDRRLKLESYAGAYYPRTRLRVIAAENGNLDALGELIKSMDSDGLQHSAATDNFYDSPRLSVIKLINFRGDNSEIKAWFKANRDNLFFDELRGRYVIQGDDF